MQSKAKTVEAYLAELPADRQAAMQQLREQVTKSLPKGFEEEMAYGMISYVVPHSLYPAGYHCDPKQALPFLSIASQKNAVTLYHMGIYADPELLDWFVKAYAKAVPSKLDMGKSCIRFKKPEQIPYALIGELCKKMKPKDWIQLYESAFTKEKKVK